MADRYWVGGTASWDGTAGTKWATSSNGTGGASVPTTADDVFFDAFSTGTCTIATGNTGAKSINCTGFTGTITGTAAISVAGSITLVAGQTYTHVGTVTITGTGTLTTAGKTFGGLTVDGSGITLTLGDALAVTGRTITVTLGTFNTANYNVTCAAIVSNNSNVRTITFGSSTITLSTTGRAIDFRTVTNLIFNSNTSQINMNQSNVLFDAPSQTFYNVSFTSAATDGNRSILSANTFNNLTLTPPTGNTGYVNLILAANQTINGTFTCSGNSVTNRTFIRSDVVGTTRTLTVATLSANDCNFRDITIAGAAAGTAPTRAGDCDGNSGITFPSSKTVYWNLSGSQSFAATGWATTSNGTPAVNNYPLPQDIAIFTDSGAAGTITCGDAVGGTLPQIDLSARTSAMTFDFFATAGREIYGSFINSANAAVTLAWFGNGALTFRRRSAVTFDTANRTFVGSGIVIDAPSGTVSLGNNTTLNGSLTLTRGTFNGNTYNVTCTTFSSNNSNTRTLTMGSGTWTLSGTGTVWNLATTTNLTFNKNTANIVLSNTTTTARTFAGGGLTYNNLTIGGSTGTSTLTITGTNTFDTLASTKTVAHTIVFPNVTTTVSNWTITGTVGNLVTLSRTGASGTFTLAKSGGGVISGVDYLSISNSTASPTNTWYAGANSTDGGGNTNWLFTVAPTPTANGNFFFFM
jgi:hypothetical protein